MHTVVNEAAMPLKHEGSALQSMRISDWLALTVTLCVVVLVCLGQDVMKLFWYDELVTLHIARLPTLGAIFHFYESGKDTTSFLPAMLVHLCQGLYAWPEIADRLPSNLAYLVTSFCMWVFAYRRYGAGFASGAVLLFAQGTTLNFASESRAYAFVIMGAAVAIACWQEAHGNGSLGGVATCGVFFGLALAILFHFFAIFLFVPFAAGEWMHQHSTGRVRWEIWASLVLFPAAIALMLPNILAARHTYGASFWAKPAFSTVTACYMDFMWPISRNLPEILLLLILFVSLQPSKSRSRAFQSAPQMAGFNRSEWVLLLLLGFIPLIAFLGSQVLGVFRTQYVLYFQVGLFLAAMGALAEIVRRSTRAGWIFAATMLFLVFVHVRDRMGEAVHVLEGKPTTRTLSSEYRPDIVEFLRPLPLPIVAEGPDTLLLMDHYMSPDLRPRLVGLTSHERATLQPRAMTNELNMEVFGQELHFPLQDYDTFTRAHPDFLLLVNPGQIEFDWLYHFLATQSQAGNNVQLKLVWGVNPTEADEIFQVHIGPPPLFSTVQ